jgi:Ca2+-binding EF-hand superfamily protein
MKTKTLLLIAVTVGLAGVSSAEEGKREIKRDRGNRVGPAGERPADRPMPREVLEKFDTNKDGKLDEGEREAAKAAHQAREAEFKKKMLEKFDKDGNGELSEEEKEEMKKAMRKERAMKFDKDGDGELNDEEKEEMKKAMKEHQKKGGPEGNDKRKEHREDHKEHKEDKAPGVLGE